jgi:hypothetical protein
MDNMAEDPGSDHGRRPTRIRNYQLCGYNCSFQQYLTAALPQVLEWEGELLRYDKDDDKIDPSLAEQWSGRLFLIIVASAADPNH